MKDRLDIKNNPFIIYIFFIIAFFFCTAGQVIAQDQNKGLPEEDYPEYSDWVEDFPDDGFSDEEVVMIYDPLEPANRFFFKFNDRLYFWFFKPVSKAYGEAVPLDFRQAFRNSFNNLMSPVTTVNSYLQGKFKEGSLEMFRFLINSTVGILGMADAAKEVFGIAPPSGEDLGQTFGYYGVDYGVYLFWPFFGPSTLRDTVGMTGDLWVRPGTYIIDGDNLLNGGLFYLGKQINNTSLTIGNYEDFLAATFDPYLAMRDAYIQSRRQMIKD